MKKILHIANDDKFVPLGKKIFDEVSEATNEYWILPGMKEIEYCKFICRNIHDVNFHEKEIIQEINTYDLLCIEFLNPKLYPLLDNKFLNIPILWIGWGGDYYWLIDSFNNFRTLLPKTFKITLNNQYLKELHYFLNFLKRFKRKSKFKSLQKINYFAPPIEEDFLAIKENYKNFKPSYFKWNYGYINDEIKQYYSDFLADGSKIIVGNSATPSNNHIDILFDLYPILLNQEIILPLNYGNNNYKNKVKLYLSQNFKKENYKVLEKFLPPEVFEQLLLECNSLIIGSMRQQALSTIIKSLYFGINVFLYKDSMNYKFFVNNGIKVHTIEELKKNPELLKFRLTTSEIKENRNKINKIWSVECNKLKLIQLIENL